MLTESTKSRRGRSPARSEATREFGSTDEAKVLPRATMRPRAAALAPLLAALIRRDRRLGHCTGEGVEEVRRRLRGECLLGRLDQCGLRFELAAARADRRR